MYRAILMVAVLLKPRLLLKSQSPFNLQPILKDVWFQFVAISVTIDDSNLLEAL